jgi:DNA polymerase-3 subunit gamma/tau
MYYLKYRPEKFADFIKPNPEIETIQNQIIKGNTGHAYILSGSRGIGKTSTARLIAKALNCTDFNGDVCGKCENCLSIKNGGFVDVIEIDGASNRGIDEARSLRESLKFSPLRGSKKVYIIDEVHMLTTEAFNSLLKALEEPPEYVVFILCTTESHKIPETIKSRCQLFILKRPTNEQIVQKLRKIVSSEKIEISDSRLLDIAVASNGGFRDAETMLTQLQNNPDFISNFDNFDSKIEFLEKTLKKDYVYLIDYISKLESNGINIVTWTASYLTLVRNVLHLKLGIEKESNVFGPDIINKISILNKNIEVSDLIKHINSFIDIYSKIRYSLNPELVFEVLFLNSLDEFKVITKVYSEPKTIIVEKKMPKEEKNYSEKNPEIVQKNTVEMTPEKPVEEILEEIKPVGEIETSIETLEINPHDLLIETIQERWSEIVSKSGAENKTIETLLKVIRPISINNDILTLEVDFKFHAERLDNNKNKLLIEKILYSVLGRKILYKTTINNKRTSNGFNTDKTIPGADNLTDYNVVPIKDLTPDDVLSMFDGGVPTK